MSRDLTKDIPTIPQVPRGTETMPAWVVEGQPVAMVSNRYSDESVELVPVKRVTPKFVILDLGHYERKFSLAKELEESGDRSGYSGKTFLADPNDELVRLYLYAGKVAALGHKAVTAGAAFAKDRTPENASTAAEALDNYMAHWNEYTHAKATYRKGQAK